MNWNFLKRNKKYFPADQYSKKYKDDVLNSLLEDNDLNKFPIVFSFLLTRSEQLKVKTVEILHKCLSKVTNKKLLVLDTLFRDRTSMDWTYDWNSELPENLYLKNMTDDEKVTILGLCTFHPNGYFREKALKLLATFETGKELPFFLLRCNDWVFEVRRVAKSLIEKRLTLNYGEQYVKNLPIVFKLKNSTHVDHSHLFNKIVKLLSQQEAVPFLHQGTKSKENEIRYFSYKLLIDSKVFSKMTLFEYFKLEKEPHLRLLLFKEIMNDISEKEFNQYYSVLKKDKFPKIRADVLQSCYSFNPNQSITELEKALFDKSGSIRSVARYLLKKQNIIDFAPYYINVIKHQQNEKLRGALLGIGEVGNKDHVGMILPYLESEKVGIVKAAIRAITLLDGDNCRSFFIKMLDHEHNGVSKQARKSLQSTSYNDLIDEIYRVYKEGKTSHSKYNAAILLSSTSKWNSIQYIIEFYANKDDDSISRYGELQLITWITTFNKTFYAPSEEQLVSIRQALMNNADVLRDDERRQIEFYLKGF